MKAIKLSMLAVTLATGITSAQAQTADEIINKHIAAIGGTDAWNKINSMKKIGSMSIQGMEIGYNETIVKGKGMRTDITAMGQNNFVILTPTAGWMYMPVQGSTEVTPLPADQLKLAASKLDVKNGMLADRSDVAKAELAGKDTINKVACYKVKITDKAGNERTDYFDASTYYIIRSEMVVKAGDEEKELSQSFSNFQKLPEGIVMPMTTSAPMGAGDIVVTSVEINKPVDEKIFVPTKG